MARGLRVRRVAGDAVERHALLGEVLDHLLVEAQLVRADRREGERVEDQQRPLPEQLLARERLALGGTERELGDRRPGGENPRNGGARRG